MAENLSATALLLRQDEDFLSTQAENARMDVEALRQLHPAVRSRCLERFLKKSGVREPEKTHIAQAEALVFAEKPSAFARCPGGVTIARNYGKLEVRREDAPLAPVTLEVPGTVIWGDYRITAEEAAEPDAYTVYPCGTIKVRSRLSGDSIRLLGGTKSLKKLFIDRKIPAPIRNRIPVLSDERGVLAVYGIGIHPRPEESENPAVRIRIERMRNTEVDPNA